MNIRYVLSDTYDYARQILGDAGPGFAKDYEWPTLAARELDAYDQPSIFIIDPWLDKEECARLQTTLMRRDDSLFVLHVVDPWPHVRGMPIFQFATDMCVHRNFAISTTYHLSEHWSSIWSRATHWAPVLTPYLYDRTKELPCTHQGRSNKIILTGNIGANDYPVRANAQLHRWINPLFWGRIERLKHPGYMVDQTASKAKLVRDEFVNFLSQYKFAFTCSSRNRLEFLKYREIAYAGCVPVGDVPGTLQHCPLESYIHWRRNFVQTWRELRKRDSEACALSFRQFMAEAREPTYWRARVSNQLETMFEGYRRAGR